MSPLGLGMNNRTYNINGDIAAGAIAKSLKPLGHWALSIYSENKCRRQGLLEAQMKDA